MIRRGKVGAAVVGLAVLAVSVLAPPGAAADEAGSGLPEPILDSLRTALEAYEEVRGDLAGDRLEAVPAGASRLAAALRSALAGGTGLVGADLIEEAAEIAEAMAEAADLAAARAEFGEVSRRVLGLAGHDPRLVEGWQVFACPMAEGFEKWIQPTEELDNPYMGTAMPRCGSAADWPAPADLDAEAALASAAEPDAQEDAGEEPEFRPGIPGLRMVDVRDHKFLWREIDELQAWERGDRITVAEYRSKVIEKTAHFLCLAGNAADEFAAVAAEVVAAVRAGFFERQPEVAETSGVEGRFSSDLDAAAARVTSLLGNEPRHQLFAPEGKKWLLRLAFGPSEAKEAREAREAGRGPTGATGEAGHRE